MACRYGDYFHHREMQSRQQFNYNKVFVTLCFMVVGKYSLYYGFWGSGAGANGFAGYWAPAGE